MSLTEKPFWQTANGIYMRIYVQPNARSSSVCGTHGSAIKVKISSPPVDGQANKELIQVISDSLSVDKTNIKIKSGSTGRNKILILNCDYNKFIANMKKLGIE